MRNDHGSMRILVAVLTGLLCATLASASDKPKDDASQMMQTALQQSVRSAGATPFEMKVTGKVYGYAKPIDIEYETKWSAMNEWFDQISFGGFVERRLAQGDKLWLQRNAGYEVLRAAQLHRMLDLAALHLASDEALKNVAHHGRVGEGTECARIESPYDSYQLCFDEKGRLVREERIGITLYPNSDFATAAKDTAGAVPKVYEYSNYANFRGRWYPKTLRVLEGGKPIIEAQVTEMRPMQAIAVGEVPPPKNVEPEVWCADPSPAYIQHFTRFLPRGDSLIGGFSTEGRIVISGVIEPNGSFGSQAITLRSTRGMDDPLKMALRDWRFHPAMCGETAIAEDKFLDLNIEPRAGLNQDGGGPVPR